MVSSEEKSLNVGSVPKDAADAIDELFHQLCVLLKKNGREIIPKKMLYSAAIYNYLNLHRDLGTDEVADAAIDELIDNIKQFWKKHGGVVKKSV